MKRGYLLGIFVALFAILFVSFVSAAGYYFPGARGVTESVINTYVDVFEPILNALFGGTGGFNGGLLFERFLIFLLLAGVIYASVSRIPFFEGQKFAKWAITIIVPLIGMRFIDYTWINSILLQYQIISVVITAILPFFIFFFFVFGIARDYPILRRIAWVFFTMVYIGLWSTTQSGTSSQIYFWTVVAAILCLIFDGKIERWFRFREMTAADRGAKYREIANLNDEIQKMERQMRTGSITQAVGMDMIRELTKQKTFLSKHI